MTGKTNNRHSPEVRARAVRIVHEHTSEHATRWATVELVASMIGCAAQTLHDNTARPHNSPGYLPPTFEPHTTTTAVRFIFVATYQRQ